MATTPRVISLREIIVTESPGAREVNLDLVYCKLLEAFEDGELHTYEDACQKFLEKEEHKNSFRLPFQSLESRRYLRFVDKGGKNRAFRYKITDEGLEILKIARDNQKVFRFLRHFRPKDKNDYFSAILKKQLSSGGDGVSSDLSPKTFCEALDALCSDEMEAARRFGNYRRYQERIFEILEGSDAIDDIVQDPSVEEFLLGKIKSSSSSRERYRFFEMYDRMRSATDWKKRVRESHGNTI